MLSALNQRQTRIISGQRGQVTDAQLAVSGFYIRLPHHATMLGCFFGADFPLDWQLHSINNSWTFALIFLSHSLPLSHFCFRLATGLHLTHPDNILPYLPKRLYHNISHPDLLTYISAHSLSSSSMPPLPLLTPSSS